MKIKPNTTDPNTLVKYITYREYLVSQALTGKLIGGFGYERAAALAVKSADLAIKLMNKESENENE